MQTFDPAQSKYAVPIDTDLARIDAQPVAELLSQIRVGGAGEDLDVGHPGLQVVTTRLLSCG